ncbi:MAG TPA: aminoacyl-tRNA hydrolase [Methylococcaceae bacterium]|nr:aminoacyl-tRNA hydrolase [Methylococcaceae bacterium]
MVGLGNPTSRYEKTRHNAGFWFLDEVARSLGVVFREESRFQGAVARKDAGADALVLLKPSTYMNRSGSSVLAAAAYYKIGVDEILVAHDELDLAPGVVRLKKGGGHGGHNGLRDMVLHLKSPEFYRLRLGIGHPGDKSQVANYVLDAPSKMEAQDIGQAVDEAMRALPLILSGDYSRAMNELNVRVRERDERG